MNVVQYVNVNWMTVLIYATIEPIVSTTATLLPNFAYQTALVTLIARQGVMAVAILFVCVMITRTALILSRVKKNSTMSMLFASVIVQVL